ncbi:hypothetical protein [Corynebacterium sp.]|uniref:hypothetical protein n=1 Tax=Corynebacterium sp. TaxID=1720 RepID=UPI0026DEDB77|nr:hypothetical protein [Corynebacterium sp.]MDO5513284.1 hypothetical protein [Corynebacterium sp.]
MAKKRKIPPTTTITVRPDLKTDSSHLSRPRTLRARRNGDSFELVSDALDLGLVTGDVVSCASGVDGRRYLSGIVRLRAGSLAQIACGALCGPHREEFVDQATDDWYEEEAVRVEDFDCCLFGFWPPEIPVSVVRMVVELSAGEYRLASTVIPVHVRQAYISRHVTFGLPAAPQAA